MKLLSTFALLSLTSVDTAAGFTPAQTNRHITKNVVHRNHGEPNSFAAAGLYHFSSTSKQKSSHITVAHAQKTDANDLEEKTGFFSDISINPPYAIAYVTFLAFAFYRSFTEPEGASMQILEGFFADPLNPGCNELFVSIFNLLGLYFVPLACLLMPGAKGQKLPATPFIFASMLGGYGFLGPYAMTRKPSPEVINKSNLGWFTANVLENKIFNWVILAVVSSAYVSSGCVSALFSDPSGLISGYGDLVSETAIASASSMDFVILTLVAASLIPEDLARRGVKGASNYAIAASTVLLPGVGAALYCALRPELDAE